jgi:hypothetical protein
MTDDSVEHKRPGGVLPPDRRRDLQHIHSRIVAVAMHKGLSKAEALDVAQQVCVRVIAKCDQYVERPGTPYLAWLWTVTEVARAADGVPVARGTLRFALGDVLPWLTTWRVRGRASVLP